MRRTRVIVAVAFVCLGLSFLASTSLLIGEFYGTDWRAMVLAHSHLFFFFPVFGILALCGFYLPSVVFADLYWQHLRYGKARLLLGLIVLAAVSWAVTKWLDKPPRALWEVAPQALASDKGDPEDCSGDSPACLRAPMLTALAKLRTEGQHRVGLSKFARNCTPDERLELPGEMTKARYCFPADALLDAATCCKAQRRFADEVAQRAADPAQRSLSAVCDRMFMPLKVFFVLLVITVGLLLSGSRNRIDRLYREHIPAVERGVMIGALAMLVWPGMDYGYQQTANALFGREGGLQLRLSLVIAPWALLLLFYFLRRLGKQGETIGQIAGVITAGVAVLRYEDLNDWAVRLLGVGAQEWIVVVLLAVTLVGFVVLLWPWHPHVVAAPPANPAGS
jgi:hypothetical protein